MPAVPKKRHSKGRRDRGRSHMALKPQQLMKCDNCGETKYGHRICQNCGFYAGKQMLAI